MYMGLFLLYIHGEGMKQREQMLCDPVRLANAQTGAGPTAAVAATLL